MDRVPGPQSSAAEHESDIEIARRQELRPIAEVAGTLGLSADDLMLFGEHKAKVKLATLRRILDSDAPEAPLVLVSATNPTRAGEGKTTCSIGLAQALCQLGKRATVALREPSMGPVFGRKGGAAGGGYSQVLPMEDINLHFTGDLHAVAAANNLIAAVLDNEIYFENKQQIAPEHILWRRAIDMNDRTLRNFVTGKTGSPYRPLMETGFDITAASEIMGILCMATGIADLKRRIGDILLGFRQSGEAFTVRDLGIEGAAAALLKDAILPNLVQTVEHGPALIHGGPFANIAQGANSVLATRLAIKLADVVVTEAGFGFDLGGEKFFDLVGPAGGFMPSVVVLVATARSLKMHGGVSPTDLEKPDVDAVQRGSGNLERHLENVRKFGVEPVVAINRFPSDTDPELAAIKSICARMKVDAEVVEVRARGGAGGETLARRVLARIDAGTAKPRRLYANDMPVAGKIDTIAREIYGADGVDYTLDGKKALRLIDEYGYSNLPVCMAKTEKSFSDDPKRLGRPSGFRITVRDIKIAAGTGFLIPLTGKILRMPGLPEHPAATDIDIDDSGEISGLF